VRNSTIYTNTPITFRRSSRKIWSKYGSNLQNVDPELRSIYIADGFETELTNKCKYFLQTGDHSIFSEEELDKLRMLVQIDQAGAEGLIVAYDTYDGDYRSLFKNGIKVHSYVAMSLFKDVWPYEVKERTGNKIDIDTLIKTPIAQLKQNPDWRILESVIKDSDNWSTEKRYYYFAKQTVHSGSYGIEQHTFRMNVLEKSGGKIMIPKEDAAYFLSGFRSMFPEIPTRNERVRKQAESEKILFNLFGHPYIITNENITENNYKEFYAWCPQSTIAEITRTALTRTQTHIETRQQRWDILGDCHDSILGQCKIPEVGEFANCLRSNINQELTSLVDGTKFRMKSEVQVGMNWGKFTPTNKTKNQLGLRECEWL
jgi:DNA polymerase family A